MSEVRNIRIDDFDYPLPDERIALHPLSRRDGCKLLATGRDGKISHHIFSDLPLLLRPDTLVVANETKVIRARMEFVKDTGAAIEIFLLEPLEPHDYVVNFASTDGCSWICLVGNKKRWKEGALTKKLFFDDGKKEVVLSAFQGDSIADGSGGMEIRFEWDNPDFSFAEIIEAAGNIPIPPYLKRKSEETDSHDYQTVYSRTEGSVAAPTAGLHFTPELIGRLRQYGDEFATVTLHVGAGTFQPVKSEFIGDHAMHTEWISVSRNTLSRLIDALENGRDVLAVGTTSVRTLESLPYIGALIDGGTRKCDVTQWMPYEERFRNIDTLGSLKNILRYLRENNLESVEATTSIMIAPGFRWRVVNKLVTNFHQPKSTLLLLVSSFLEPELPDGVKSESPSLWRRVYGEALQQDYRFLSYGDACLFSRGMQPVELPAAKSIVIRKATIDAVFNPEGLEQLSEFSLCDDTEYYIQAVKKVLASVGLPDRIDVYIGEGAAPLRFLTALAASLPGANVRITAAPPLRKRPIKPLLDTLIAMGADITFNEDFADWHIDIRGMKLKGGKIRVDTSFTSQYLSALLLASPLWEEKMELPEDIHTVSRPYFDMTRKMMENHRLQPEADWSGAAFFYEFSLISRRNVLISYLTPPAMSLQGDSAVCDIYAMLGVNTSFHRDFPGKEDHNDTHPAPSALLSFDEKAFLLARERGVFEFDFTDYPDMVPSVAVALCYCGIPFRFTGVSHLRFKECNRLSVLQNLLVKIGYEVNAESDMLSFSGKFLPLEEFPLQIDPSGDHRMAMAFYPLELLGMVTIEDKDVVSKSFPDFYLQFKNLS